MTRFNNMEVLFEISGAGAPMALLGVLPSDTTLYFGLSEEQRSSPPKNPFSFFDMVIAIPVSVMQAAFPDGPATVPARDTVKAIKLGGTALTLHAATLGSGAIAFRIEGERTYAMVGELAPRRPAALPDDFALTDWTTQAGVSYRRLGDARAAAPAPHSFPARPSAP